MEHPLKVEVHKSRKDKEAATFDFGIIAYAQEPPLYAHADVSGEIRGLNFGLSLYLRTYFEYASNEG